MLVGLGSSQLIHQRNKLNERMQIYCFVILLFFWKASGNHKLGNCSTVGNVLNTTTSSGNGWRWNWHEGYIAVAGIAFATIIVVGIIVAVTVVCIKRKSEIYDQTTQRNLNEHPYMNVPASQQPNNPGHSIQVNELQTTCLNICCNCYPHG